MEQAPEEVRNVGYSYFGDFIAEITIEEILNQIKKHIQGTRRQTGLRFWEVRRDAQHTVLTRCSEEELERTMEA